jgi:asparagine synthase (glutamine-hydrolysing)
VYSNPEQLKGDATVCGIAGWASTRVDIRQRMAVLSRMGAAVACRGPDDEGYWVGDGVGFAHRRLIVIDPLGGRQPMTLTDGRRRLAIVYNGELYNTDALRAALMDLGHSFTGWSDTEVLLHALWQWGEQAVSRLDGIFAFAAWEEPRGTLLLARDRLGVKPLFYWHQGPDLVFGSEIKAILAHPNVPHVVDRDGLSELVAVGPARTPGHGLFRNVGEVKPGSLVVWSGGRLTRTQRYWQLQSAPHSDDLPTTVATVRERLRDAVTRQLVSDVPLATFLSGGLDSSAVTAFAQEAYRLRGKTLHTFSVDFQDQARYFEPTAFQKSLDTPWARDVSARLGTYHHEIVLDSARLADHVDDALLARDHPGMADIDISLLLFCRAVRQHVTVAVSGEGADELFGGYGWCHRPDALAAPTFPWARRLADRVRLLRSDVRERLDPVGYVDARYREALDEVPRLDGEPPDAARIREVLYLNLTRFLPTLLDRKDRMSMATGLEVRVPFCDHRLVEYVWNIPWDWKTLDGEPKGILRRALSGVLPDTVLHRPKSPYPTTHHPVYAEVFRARFRATLKDPYSPLRALYDFRELERLAELDPKSWDLPWFGQMMGVPALYVYLVQLDHWFRRYDVDLVW